MGFFFVLRFVARKQVAAHMQGDMMIDGVLFGPCCPITRRHRLWRSTARIRTYWAIATLFQCQMQVIQVLR